MLDPSPFFDYNISERCLRNNNYDPTMKLLYELGYRTVAINQIVEEQLNEADSRKKKKKGEARETLDLVPEPFEIKAVEGCGNLKILNRLTVICATPELFHKISKSPNYKKYDILAVLPTTDQAFQFCSNHVDADILCFDPETKSSMKRNRKLLNQMVDRGFHFEIPYGHAIEDSTKRRRIIQTAHLYHSLIKSKNIIVSSGATKPVLIRGPYDVINLGFIFGLSEQQSKNAISYCGKIVFANSVRRKHLKSVIFVENIEKEATNTDDSVIEILDCTTEIDQSSRQDCKKSGLNDVSVIEIKESDGEGSDIREPTLKKPRQ